MESWGGISLGKLCSECPILANGRYYLVSNLDGIYVELIINQSPQAALGSVGFVERLRQAYDMGMDQSEAIVWARTRSYLNPETGQWNAPGLGNTVQDITSDQSRRQQAITQVLNYRQSAVKQFETEIPNRHEHEENRVNDLLSLDLEAI